MYQVWWDGASARTASRPGYGNRSWVRLGTWILLPRAQGVFHQSQEIRLGQRALIMEAPW